MDYEAVWARQKGLWVLYDIDPRIFVHPRLSLVTIKPPHADSYCVSKPSIICLFYSINKLCTLYLRTAVLLSQKDAVTLNKGNVYCLYVRVSDITFFQCKQNTKKIKMKSWNILDSEGLLTRHYEGGTFPSKRHKLITLRFSVRIKKTKVVDKFRALRVEGE